MAITCSRYQLFFVCLHYINRLTAMSCKCGVQYTFCKNTVFYSENQVFTPKTHDCRRIGITYSADFRSAPHYRSTHGGKHFLSFYDIKKRATVDDTTRFGRHGQDLACGGYGQYFVCLEATCGAHGSYGACCQGAVVKLFSACYDHTPQDISSEKGGGRLLP